MADPVYPKVQRLARSVPFPNPGWITDPSALKFSSSLIQTLANIVAKIHDDIKDGRTYRYTPTGSSDTRGGEGDVAYDANFLYVKTQAGWKRVAISSF
jgi:hypothetical protein